MWFVYNKNGQMFGPLEEFAVANMIRLGQITETTLVQKKTWQAPKQAGKVFATYFRNAKLNPEPEAIPSSMVPPRQATRELNDRLFVLNFEPNDNWKYVGFACIGLIFVLMLLISFSKPGVIGLILLLLLSLLSGAGFVFAILLDKYTEAKLLKKAADELISRNQDMIQLVQDQLQNNTRENNSQIEQAQNILRQAENKIREANASLSGTAVRAESIGRRYLECVIELNKKRLNQENYPTCKEQLTAAILSCRAIGIRISPGEEQQYIRLLKEEYEKLVRAIEERERQKILRAQMREEERRQREIEELEEQAEREKRRIEKELKDAIARNEQAAEIEELKRRLADAENNITRAKSMAQQTRRGYIYIISNIGSFGKDVYKIGMSRRLNPQERVDELGGASVPFPFDIHAMLTSDDAPSLETSLHQAFHKYRVNKINLRKEFFKVSLEEIIKEAKKFCGEIEYQADAEALQYYQSLNMSEEDAEYIESVYADNPPTDGE